MWLILNRYDIDDMDDYDDDEMYDDDEIYDDNVSHASDGGFGEWTTNLDDATCKEIDQYCRFHRLCTRYMTYLSKNIILPKEEEVVNALNEINTMIATFPAASKLLRVQRYDDSEDNRLQTQVSYHTSYLVNWGENMHTRSGMLTSLPDLVANMEQHKPLFESCMPPTALEFHEQMYNEVMQSFQRWKQMAEAALKVPLHMLRGREQSGRDTRAMTVRGRGRCPGASRATDPKLARLLRQLQMLRG